MTTEVTDSRWSECLKKAISASDGELRFISPFIKHDELKRLLGLSQRPISVITRFNLRDFAARVSDTSALRLVLEQGGEVRGVKNLHSKLYLFGSQRAVITSANLTHAGLNRNHEFGLDSDDENVVTACGEYFKGIWDRTDRPLTHKMLDEWDEKLDRQWSARRPESFASGLGDYGEDIGLTPDPFESRFGAFLDAPQFFCKLQGMSSDRSPLEASVFEEIKRTGCHWALAYPSKRRPRAVMDGALMFISRFTKDPADIRVFGRALGFEHVPGRDEATEEDIKDIDWKRERRQYIRVQGPEFVAGSLRNGVSLYALMREMGADIFASTYRHKTANHGNIDPFKAYMQQPQVELTPAGSAELNIRLQKQFEEHGLVSKHELSGLYAPKHVEEHRF